MKKICFYSYLWRRESQTARSRVLLCATAHRAIANNVDQMARATNASRSVDEDQITRLQELIETLYQALKELM